jgi:hypothetical protein
MMRCSAFSIFGEYRYRTRGGLGLELGHKNHVARREKMRWNMPPTNREIKIIRCERDRFICGAVCGVRE